MARSKRCVECLYSGRLSRASGTDNWRENVTCDHLIVTGTIKDKGPDPDNCLLFVQRTPENVRATKLF